MAPLTGRDPNPPESGPSTTRSARLGNVWRPLRRRIYPARALIAVGLLTSLLALTKVEAGFTATTANQANTMASDTLDPPTAFTAGDGGTIDLDWTATADSYADGHRIFRSTAPGGPYTQIAEVTPRSNVTYEDTPPYGTHHYVVRAFAGTWESVDSAERTSELPFDCPADPDLRACIRFDADVAGTYPDESGYGNTVTHSNASLIPGVTGNAVDGTPSSQYEMSDSSSLDLTTAMTVEVWLRVDSLPTSGRVGILDNDGQYALLVYAGTGLRCSTNLTALAHVPVTTGVWFHAACVWDGATLTLYVNGVAAASSASTGTMDPSNTQPVGLLDTSPAFDEPIDGAMDNLRIWSVARTQAQVCADAGLIGC